MVDTLDEIINKPYALSPEQAWVVRSDTKYIRLVAGAGTGKTETLTRRLIRLILCDNASCESIVAFTFTEKAAEEMKNRIYMRVRHLAREEKCNELGKIFVGTIHSFCLRLLQDKCGYDTFDVLDDNQEVAFISHHRRALGIDTWKKFEIFQRSVNVVYDELLDKEQIKNEGEEFSKFFNSLVEYENLLHENRFLTFSQIVYFAIQEIEKNPSLISHIKYLLVDEYQDINKAQEKLIILIAQNGASVFAVGDPRQCIYQWRGSTYKCFEEFEKNFPGCQTLELKENRRSQEMIVGVANSVAENMMMRYPALLPTKQKKHKPFLTSLSNPEEEARWIVEQIEKIKSDTNCKYSDITILLRSVMTSADPILEKLREKRIPFMVGGRVGLFRREEAQTLGRLFAWLAPHGFWRLSFYDLREKIEGDVLLDAALNLWRNLFNATSSDISNMRTELKSFKESLNYDQTYKPLTKIYYDILTILQYKEWLNPDDLYHAGIMANLGRFNNLLTDYEIVARRNKGTIRLSNLLDGLCWYMNAHAIQSYDQLVSDDLSGVDAISVMTVHQAKGLEWSVVFIPALTDRRFPSFKTGQERDWFVPRKMFDVERYEGSIDDERRLFYVAVTRAKDCLVLSYFLNTEKQRQTISKFVLDIEEKLRKIGKGALPHISIDKPAQDEEKIHSFDATELVDYSKCPYFYRFRHIWRYNAPINMLLNYGKSLHSCLYLVADFLKKNYSGKEAIEQAVKQGFFLPFAPFDKTEELKKQARRVLTTFVKKYKDELLEAQNTEVRLELFNGSAIISGKADVISPLAGSAVKLREYKTSEKVATYEDMAFQLRIYALALRRNNIDISDAAICFIENAYHKDVPVRDTDIKKAESDIKDVVYKIISGNFCAKPPKFCKYCDFRKICRFTNIV